MSIPALSSYAAFELGTPVAASSKAAQFKKPQAQRQAVFPRSDANLFEAAFVKVFTRQVCHAIGDFSAVYFASSVLGALVST